MSVSYIRNQKLWRKRFKGYAKPISISLKQLENGWAKAVTTEDRTVVLTFEPQKVDFYTKEGTRHLAQLWAERVQSQLTPPEPPKADRIIADLTGEIKRLQSELDGSWKANPDGYDQTLGELYEMQCELDLQTVAKQKGIDLNKERDHKQSIAQLLKDAPCPPEVHNFMHFQHLLCKPEPDNRLIKFWQVEFLSIQQVAKLRSPGGWANFKRNLQAFVDFMGVSSSVDKIDATTWESFFKHCKNHFGDAKAKDCLAIAKKFVRYLYKKELIELPKDLDDYSITIEDKTVQHFELDEMRYLMTVPGILGCFIHLMANCGFYQIDIATLTSSMFKDGYIVRQRHKRKVGENLPTVHWKLWPETIALINEFRTNRNGLLFTREDGSSWYKDELINDKHSKDDRISPLWHQWEARNPQSLSLKYIRKSAAQHLPKADFSMQVKFLGQCPPKGSAKHYVDTPQKNLDRSIAALGKLYHRSV